MFVRKNCVTTVCFISTLQLDVSEVNPVAFLVVISSGSTEPNCMSQFCCTKDLKGEIEMETTLMCIIRTVMVIQKH